jgi:non-specific serine/threonine protein kinase/serine/threonine-protein kinase
MPDERATPTEGPETTTRPLGEPSGSFERVGPYKVLQQIGEGGFGVVYLAQQDEPIRRRVALKVIKLGMDTKQVVARFESERQTLALMDHPNVTKVLDAGVTKLGRPYFVMEYVKGVPITEHCDRNRLTMKERLELLLQVCEGVHHAHQKGIIHRDIKPSNILVATHDGKSVPKIIDFGVAKATEHRLTEHTVFTQFGQLIGTPEYMSPEQAEMTAQDIDIRTDVYSLGVLMYELLVGALPFDSKELRAAGIDEIRRRIREDEPSKPSTRLTTLGKEARTTAAKRRTDPATLAKRLRGDLDAVTMKALDKDRARRYGSATELAADIRRFLARQPVLAHPPGILYQAGKFVRRHRMGTAALATVGLALVAGATTTTFQAVRATRAEKRATQRFAQVRELAKSLVFDVHEQIRDLAGATGAREFIVSQAVTYLESLSADAGDDVELIEELESGWAQLARIQAMGAANLGALEDARHSYSRGRELIERLLRTDPSNPDYRLRLTRNLYDQAYILVRQAHHEDAAELLNESLRLCEALVAENPTRRDAKATLADVHSALGDVEHIQGRPESALRHAKARIETIGQLLADQPEDFELLGELAAAHATLVERLFNANSLNEARVHVERAHELALQLSLAQPENVNYQSQRYGVLALHSRILLASGEHERSIATGDEALKLGRELADADPENAEAQNILLKFYDPMISLVTQYGSDAARPAAERIFLLRTCVRYCNERAEVYRNLLARGAASLNAQVRAVAIDVYTDRCRRELTRLESEMSGP